MRWPELGNSMGGGARMAFEAFIVSAVMKIWLPPLSRLVRYAAESEREHAQDQEEKHCIISTI